MLLRLHANKSKNLLTWYQAIALDFHFAVEQRARGFLRTFYGERLLGHYSMAGVYLMLSPCS